MSAIPQWFIEQLLNRVDIVDIIATYVDLKEQGDSFKGLCPFHDEKTSSFSISRSKQVYHCFGCGVSGNVITFLKEKMGKNYVDCIHYLAERYSMTVPVEENSNNTRTKANIDILNSITQLYIEKLKTANQTVAYLTKRGIAERTIENFAIGYAPNEWDTTKKWALQQEDQTVWKKSIEIGHVIQKGDKVYDRFRDRIMFPIRSTNGVCLGFGARTLIDGVQPKYINSSESEIFHKSKILYGLYEFKKNANLKNCIIVTEGYMDVIALHQVGITNAVATLGTAITLTHVQILFERTSKVVFCFDGDDAGRKSSIKAFELCLSVISNKKEVGFILLGKGLDPDTYVCQFGREKFEDLVTKAPLLSVFFMQLLTTQSNPNSTEGKIKFINNAKTWLDKVQDSIYKTFLLHMVADKVGIKDYLLARELGIVGKFYNTNFKKNNNTITQPIKKIPLEIKVMAFIYKYPQLKNTLSKQLMQKLEQTAIGKDLLTYIELMQLTAPLRKKVVSEVKWQHNWDWKTVKPYAKDIPKYSSGLEQEFTIYLESIATPQQNKTK